MTVLKKKGTFFINITIQSYEDVSFSYPELQKLV